MLVLSCSHPLRYCSQCVLLGPWLHGVCGRDVIFLMFGVKVSVLLQSALVLVLPLEVAVLPVVVWREQHHF